MFLGRVKGTEAPLSRENAFCQLELIEGFWHIEDLNTPSGVKVNGRACKRQRLMPDDEITIGKHRYRINFEAPRYSAPGRLAKSRSGNKSASAGSQTAVMPSPAGPPVGGVLGRLVPVGGGQDIPLTKPRVTIGRRPPCDIVIEKRSISGRHCDLELINGYWQVRDLDSRNGIRVNNVRVKQAWILPKGRLCLAEHRFQLEYVGVGQPPAEALSAEQARRERGTQSDQRSLMEKLGLSERDLQRAAFDPDSDDSAPRRWNVLDND